MKNLQHTLEGLLDNDGLDATVTTAIETKLATRLNDINIYTPQSKKDLAGRKIAVGDMVLVFGNQHLKICTIEKFERGGRELTVASITNPDKKSYPNTNCVLKIFDITQVSSLLKMLGL